MTRRLELEISESVWTELEKRRRETGDSMSGVVDAALSDAFDLQRHSLFQVSTSNALAQGVFAGAVTVHELRRHGDFGLGTFAGLDGELIVIDGHCFRATASGSVGEVDEDCEVPFAVVTRFTPDVAHTIDTVPDLKSLETELDLVRPSENLFVAIRADAVFDSLALRAACPARTGEGLLEATRHQSEFTLTDVAGTLIGFWAPDYAQAVGIPGYHFHFISTERDQGGHVLDARGEMVEVGVQTESSIHLAIPETAEFLTADLSGDHREAIDSAESLTRTSGDDR